MHSDWWLAYEVWANMSPDDRWKHRVNVRAYFLSEKRRASGSVGSLEGDYHEAETEELRIKECNTLYCQIEKMSKTIIATRNEIFRLAIIRHLSNSICKRVGDINDGTSLPSDPKARESLAASVGWETIGRAVALTSEIQTVASFRRLLEKIGH